MIKEFRLFKYHSYNSTDKIKMIKSIKKVCQPDFQNESVFNSEQEASENDNLSK